MNIESVMKAKELMEAQKKAKEATALALTLECESQFAECRAVLKELQPQLKMNRLEIGGNGFSYRPHETLSHYVAYAITPCDGKIAYRISHGFADSKYLTKEEFFDEVTKLLASYL